MWRLDSSFGFASYVILIWKSAVGGWLKEMGMDEWSNFLFVSDQMIGRSSYIYRACLVVVFKNRFLFLKTKRHQKRVWERDDFCFLCFLCSREASFQRKKEVVLVVFFTVQGRVVLCVFFSCFFVFPYMWFLLQQHEMKVMEDEDGSHVGLPWWSWHE